MTAFNSKRTPVGHTPDQQRQKTTTITVVAMAMETATNAPIVSVHIHLLVALAIKRPLAGALVNGGAATNGSFNKNELIDFS